MADMTSIHQMLVDMTRTTAFTAEALKQFQDAIGKAKELEEKLAKAETAQNYYMKLAEDRERVIKAHERREKDIVAREEAVDKREVAMTSLETKVAVAEAKEAVRKEVFETLFKNRSVREQFQDNVTGGTNHNGIYNSTSETHNVTKTVQEE